VNNKNLHKDNSPNSGFEVPDSYFEMSKQHILARVSQGGLSTPENYFEESKARILSKISSPKTNKTIRLNPWWYAAAATVLITLSVILYSPKPQATQLMANLSTDEILSYLANNNLNEISLHDIPVTSTSMGSTPFEEDIIDQLDEDFLLTEF
jgi:hypothetical protein